ncbi:hypothetical protein BXZ70DRAFT_368496 [Cristinia sonorae]|uniref:F-box domain-containing protein n=1 Tax=Cristinia sonorae TaxID=1940300 RepID=A0A8K0UIM7_9AGAR|nr:hypothetical protein BXZ70DRAFT_368496 [Cristinia sonorae]
MKTAGHLPRFPPEVWENVLDLLPELQVHHSVIRNTLLSCCLVCHDWLPRSAVHLRLSQASRTTTIRSRTDLLRLVQVLTATPYLCSRVEKLRLVAEDEDRDQSWVSSVPMRLASKLPHLDEITLLGFNLSNKHPEFYRSYALFPLTQRLVLVDVRYTRLSQLARLVAATRARSLVVKDVKDSTVSKTDRDDFFYVRKVSAVDVRYLRSGLHSQHLNNVRVQLEWAEMSWACQYWMFSAQHIVLETAWPDVLDGGFQRLHAEGLGYIAGLFQRNVSQAEPPKALELELIVGEFCHVTLKKGDLLNVMVPQDRHILKVDMEVEGLDDQRLKILAELLISLSAAPFNTINLLIRGRKYSNADLYYWVPQDCAVLTRSVRERWEHLDAALLHPSFAGIHTMKVMLRLPPKDLPHPYMCQSDLMKDLLPYATQRQGMKWVECPASYYAQEMCIYHILGQHSDTYYNHFSVST